MQPTIKNTHLLSNDEQAIVALCTPRGSGALALIRISGSNAYEVVDTFARLSSGQRVQTVPSHTIHYGSVIDHEHGDRCVDTVLFLIMHGPKTFTGQNTVEISCHNNPFIIEHIVTIAVAHGARHAGQGEFSRRAYLNGKIDLVQAEAINELIHAQTEQALVNSLAMLGGSLSQSFRDVEGRLITLLSHVEASFEFLDEEQRDLDFDAAIKHRIDQLCVHIDQLKQQFAQQKQIKEGVRIAIVGITNAGKSTLFNALVGQDRAIVADVAGTTRDSIETSVYRKGTFWLVIDTAGIRQTDDVLEQKGIERSFHEAAGADIIVLLIDPTQSLTEQQRILHQSFIDEHKNKIILVINKIDQVETVTGLPLMCNDGQYFSIAAQSRLGIDVLEKAIEEKIQKIFAQATSPFLLNQRHFNLLTEIEQGLEFIANSYSSSVHYELIAYQLRDLIEKVSELTGKHVTEQTLDAVFKQFCIGK